MPLRFTGKTMLGSNSRTFMEAFDGEARVSVSASSEALQDHGESAVEAKASEKYDSGQVSDGTVLVNTSDFT